MEDLKLRGYVCPEDFTGSPAETIQKALDLAAREDIRKVVLAGQYRVERTIFLPSEMELVLRDGASIRMDGEGPLFANKAVSEPEKNSWSFEDRRIYLKGEGSASLRGDLGFWHAGYVVLEGLRIEGAVRFEFCREVRMEQDQIFGAKEALVLMRGCNNFILQYLHGEAEETAVLLDTRLEKGPYVIGKDAEIHEIILRDCELNARTAVGLQASEDLGIFNAQIDHIRTSGAGVRIGDGSGVPVKRFFNITAAEFAAKGQERILQNETSHCFFGES